ncbi:TPA: CopG family transcriptional regulator [Candidatus Bathyarchaeota archaeon]|nr:CopG family transcriptional regulator [Candidatus Bathyarchaeota archaeon]
MTKYVTVSAKIDVDLRKKLKELGIKPSEVIRKALEKEVEERTKKLLYKKAERASRIIAKVGSEAWVKTIREGREARKD